MAGLFVGNDDGTYTPLEIENAMAETLTIEKNQGQALAPNAEAEKLRLEMAEKDREIAAFKAAEVNRTRAERESAIRAKADAPIAGRKLDPAHRDTLSRAYAVAFAAKDSASAVADLDAILDALPAKADLSKERLEGGAKTVPSAKEGDQAPNGYDPVAFAKAQNDAYFGSPARP